MIVLTKPRSLYSKRLAWLIVCAAVFALVSCSSPSPEPLVAPELYEVSALSDGFSEPGGYFDTDNLISNETAYWPVVDALEPTGGVYLGVGPEQNYNYIGRLRPEWAFILDIRSDNRLQHWLMGAILAQARNPKEYLCWTFSVECPEVPGDASFPDLVEAIERAQASPSRFDENLATLVRYIREAFGVSLTSEDEEILGRIHRAFFSDGLSIRFHSHGRPPMPHHPSYRSLLTEVNERGESAHFLSRPEDYAHVRSLATRGRLVPVVGNFAGPHAIRAIGDFMEERQLELSAFYLSNVEFYLVRSGAYSRFVENLRHLPSNEKSLLIRAYFAYGYPHPQSVPGHRSTLIRQHSERFLELFDQGTYQDYWEICTLDFLD